MAIALLSQIGQLVPEAEHAAVRGAVGTFLDAAFFRDPAGTNLTPAECVAEIIDRNTLLPDERTCSGVSQQISKVLELSFQRSSMRLAML
jgi:hypothetical protein